MNLYKYVSESLNKKLGTVAKLEVPPSLDFGDFSTNVAMVMAGKTGKNPRVIAEKILPKIKELDFIAKADIAGPGFINLKLKDKFITDSALKSQKIKAEKPLVIDMDYGAYNVAKSMHIGHLRTSIVGDTLNRLARFLGHKTISYNHIGDWGRSMGMVIAWIQRLHPDWPFFQKNFDADRDYSDYAMSIKELNTYYPSAAALAKQDPKFMELAQKITADLQRGHRGYNALYNVFIPISLKSVDDLIRRLNMLPFDNTLGEKNAAQYEKQVEKILRSKSLLQKSEGAEVIPVKKAGDNAPMPPLMFRNSRGATTYDATDIMALYYRKITDNPDKIIYLTDSRQKLHFKQLFRVADLMGLFPIGSLEHIGYGTINSKDGKPFTTRGGNAADLADIMNTVKKSVRKRIKENNKKLGSKAVDAIALAALKFNDLSHDLRSDYIFDPEAVTSFEGRTGPYILYSAVRLNSVLKKAGKFEAKKMPKKLTLEERNLLVKILDFDRTVLAAFDNRATDILANYAYDLCQLINAFYHNCPILSKTLDKEVRAGRLTITKIAYDTLAKVIDLMGLIIPPEM